jgi:osmotically-inducible protein OsmY
MYELSLARAHADFGVAKAKCHEKADDGKKACVAEAKDVEHKAKAEAKAQRHTAMPERRAAGAASVVTSSKHEGAKEYAEDSLITTKVKAAMFEDSSLKSMEINVETYKGVVQLSGFVRSRDEINKAVELARKVKGVESVKDAMIVKGRQ